MPDPRGAFTGEGQRHAWRYRILSADRISREHHGEENRDESNGAAIHAHRLSAERAGGLLRQKFYVERPLYSLAETAENHAMDVQGKIKAFENKIAQGALAPDLKQFL